jgi:hypothetical protein
MFAEFNEKLLTDMRNQAIVFHYHTYGIAVNDYNKLPALNRFFKVISTDVTAKGEPYLAALEAFNYPIYALMDHPEY